MKTIISIAAALVLSGCASDSLTQYARAQTGYNVALTIAAANAETCVADFESPACFVKGETALKIETARASAYRLLGQAYEAALDGDDDAVSDALDLVEVALAELNNLLEQGESQ